jgi:hypothetical protein
LAEPGFLRMDVPVEMDFMTAWLAAVGLSCVGTVLAMTRGDWPAAGTEISCMGLASQAFG